VYYFFMDEDTASHRNAQFADNQVRVRARVRVRVRVRVT